MTRCGIVLIALVSFAWAGDESPDALEKARKKMELLLRKGEVLEKGQEIECRVLSVDQDRRRIALGLKQLEEEQWSPLDERFASAVISDFDVTFDNALTLLDEHCPIAEFTYQLRVV